MRPAARAALSVYALATLSLISAPLQAQVQSDRLVASLVSGTRHERAYALERVNALTPDQMNASIREALIEALFDEVALHRSRIEARQRGERVDPLPQPYLLQRLARSVALLRHPSSIPVLIRALGSDLEVVRALGDMRTEAAPGVLAVVRSRHSSGYAVNHALMALRCMVESSDTAPLPQDVETEIRSAVRSILHDPETDGSPAVLMWNAVHLAVALGDPELAQLVHDLASDPTALAERGITRSDLLERTRERARQRLGGEPARPPCT